MADAGTFVVAGVGLLLVAAGLWLWAWATGRTHRAAATRRLDRQLQSPPTDQLSATDGFGVMAAEVEAAAAAAARPARQAVRMPDWLLGTVSPRLAACFALALCFAIVLTGLRVGAGSALGLLVVALALAAFWSWLRIQAARRRIVQQLPGFLDVMVRLISIGNSTHAAFQMAVNGARAPLRGHLEDAVGLSRAGVEIDQAVAQIAARTHLEELHLTAAILGLSVRHGGRADLLLERVSAYMRDLEQAQEELNAMSAETRLSAWVLGLLPLVVGGAIVIVNSSYFTRMWIEPTGQKMILGAVALQALGAFLLYRLARLA
ncbi:MAG: type II secretion system F family protein [Burkholderiales bacterium]|nr:type II secretion system F family protein [Burkholderiales bacterium]